MDGGKYLSPTLLLVRRAMEKVKKRAMSVMAVVNAIIVMAKE